MNVSMNMDMNMNLIRTVDIARDMGMDRTWTLGHRHEYRRGNQAWKWTSEIQEVYSV